MKIISQASNKNNSRVTIEFYGTGPLSNGSIIAEQFDCNFSHNVTVKPSVTIPMANGPSFGTVSFNKGNHIDALAMFIDLHKE